jgi:hypothetical protein
MKLEATVPPPFDFSYSAQQRRQARLGLAMTPAERLAWLESKLAEVRQLLGTARRHAKKMRAVEL